MIEILVWVYLAIGFVVSAFIFVSDILRDHVSKTQEGLVIKFSGLWRDAIFCLAVVVGWPLVLVTIYQDRTMKYL